MINSFIYPNENFYQHKTSSCNSFDISSDIFHFSYQVYAWRKSQYLFYDQRKCTLIFRSSHWRSSVKKDVLQNFAKFTGKHLCQSLFFDKFAGLGSCRPVYCRKFSAFALVVIVWHILTTRTISQRNVSC